jgi:hypothetical protein
LLPVSPLQPSQFLIPLYNPLLPVFSSQPSCYLIPLLNPELHVVNILLLLFCFEII